MVKVLGFAVLAAIVAASPASAHHSHHRAAAYRGHTRDVVVDPNGLRAFSSVPGDPPDSGPFDPALNGGGSAGYNAAEKIH